MRSIDKGSPYRKGVLGKGVICYPTHRLVGRSLSYHLYPGVNIPLNDNVINEVLKVLEVLSKEYESKFRGMDLGWLRDTLVEPTCRDKIYWPTVEGITSTGRSVYAKRWLHLVTKRIRPSGNYNNVTFT